MAINFPNNPAVNDTFTVGGTTFTFTGVKWETSAVVELSSDTTPSLGGTLDAGTNNINNVGVITATSFSGNLTGNADTATTATYAETAGISTYATTAGVSTNAQGLTGDPSIQVTNATVLGNLDVQGTTTTIDTAVTEVDSLQVDGNVGIGTTNATQILHVQTGTSDEITTFKVKTAGQVELSRNHSSAPYIKTLMNSGDPNIILGDSVGDRVLINGHGASYFNAGSVAIGTATGETNFLTTINGDLSLGEKNGADNTYIDQKQNGSLEIINSGRTSSEGSVRINRHNNISGDTTYFRDFVVYDGKGTALLTVDGSAGSVSDSKGGLRDIPLNDESTYASYTLVASDAGKVVHAHSTTTTVVVPNSVFSVGNVVTILNGGTGNIAINQGSGLSLRNNGDGSTGNRTLAQFGMATIYFTGASVCYISGSNMT